jgi:hypothetical protein
MKPMPPWTACTPIGGDALGVFRAATLDDGDQQIDQRLALDPRGARRRMAVGAVHLAGAK